MSTRGDGHLCVRIAETFLNCVLVQGPERGLDVPVCRSHYAALKACCAEQNLIAIKLVTDRDSVDDKSEQADKGEQADNGKQADKGEQADKGNGHLPDEEIAQGTTR